MSRRKTKAASVVFPSCKKPADAGSLMPDVLVTGSNTHHDIVHVLQELIREIVDSEPHGSWNPDQSILEYGLDSLRMAEFQYAIEEKFGVSISLSKLLEGPAVEELARTIAVEDGKEHQISALAGDLRNGDLRNGRLSHEQEGIWVQTQFAGGDRAYREQVLLRFTGRLRVDYLRAAIQAVADANEAFRTVFVTGQDDIVQQIHPRVAMYVIESRIDTVSDGEIERCLVEQSLEMASAPFSLETAPLIRFHVFRIAEDDHALLVTAHHLVADGRALEILGGQLADIYNGLLENAGANLRQANESYLEHCRWQRSAQGEGEITKSLSYWRERLKDAPARLALPYDRTGERTFVGERIDTILPADTEQALSELARAETVTLFMVYSAAYAALLSALSGQTQVIFGIPVANRERPETRHVVGQFANTIPILVDCSGALTFRELLARTKEAVLQAVDHQHAPFRLIAKCLPAPRIGLNDPRLQAALSFVPPFALPNLSGIETRQVPIGQPIAKCDMTIELHGTESGTACSLVYDSGRFHRSSMEPVLDRYVSLLTSAADNPECPALPEGITEPNDTDATAQSCPQRPRPVSNLTDDQLLIWSGQKLYPQIPLYNIVGLNRIEGELDHAGFERAFDAFVSETDALRTVIVERNSVPVQEVLSHNPGKLEIVDFSHESGSAKAFEEWMAARMTRTLAMDTALFDAALVKLADDVAVLYFVTHHIISDGVSRGLARHRLADLYTAGEKGNSPEIPSAGFQGVVARQLQFQTTANYRRHREYWETKLSVPLEPLTFYGIRPNSDDLRVCRIEVPLCPHRRESLLRMARSGTFANQPLRVSILNTMSAALAALVHRVSDSCSFVLGTHTHNRRDESSKEVFGLLMRELPLIVQIEPGESFSALAVKIAQENIEGKEHMQVCPLGSGRRTERMVTINYLRIGAQEHFGAATATPLYVSHGFGTDVLSLLIHDQSGTGMDGLSFDFQTATFASRDRDRLIGHFVNVLDAIIENPDQAIDGFPISSPDEPAYASENLTRPLPRRDVWCEIRSRIRLAPERVALRHGSGCMKSYGELERRSREIAAHLFAQGVRPGAHVGVCLDRSFQMIEAILAVTRIGATYVVLDPLSPAGRLASVLASVDVHTILVSDRLRDKFSRSAPPVIVLDTIPDTSPCADTGVLNYVPSEQDILYAITTSGSTGTPKTAGVYHSGFRNLVHWYVNELSMSAADVVHVVSALSFDLTQKNIFAPLMLGATLCLSKAEIFDPEIVTDEIRSAGVTWMNTTPSHFYSLLEFNRGRYSALSTLRRVVLGGESVDPGRLREWYDSMGSAAPLVINTYGPTECTDVVAYHVLTAEDLAGTRPIPIGRAVHNVSLYILDTKMNPVPQGVRGNLWVGGAAVGAGYLNLDCTESQTFTASPFADSSGLLYDTGDRVRQLPCGSLEYLGREDNQIKFRGVRLDLGEIESYLRGHPSIVDAVVCRSEKGNTTELIAYILAKDPDNPVPVGELRAFLGGHLPAYCLPARYRLLREWPLTRSGKVDRSAVPNVQSTEYSELRAREPKTDREKSLAALWSEILRVPVASVDENFFELGGDSLMALQMVSSIRNQGIHVLPRDFFERPSISGLLESAGKAAGRTHGTSHEGIVPLSPIQRWFLERRAVNPNRFNQSILLETPADVDLRAMTASLEAVVAAHGALRSRFSVWNGDWAQVVMPEESQDVLQHIDLSRMPAHSREGELLRCADEIHGRIHIGRGPVFQCALFTLGTADPGRLLLVAHHLVIDGVSWRILIEDLLAHYNTVREKRAPAPCASGSDPWRVWVRRLTEYARSAEQRAEVPVWDDPGYARLAPFPYDFDPAIALNVARLSGEERAELTAEQTQTLLSRAADCHGAGIQALLVGALVSVLHDWSGSKTLLVDMESHGREALFDDIDISRTVGWFTAIYPILVDVDGSGNLDECVQAVARSLRRVPNHGVGFGLLKYLGDADDRAILDQLPRPRVAFNFMGHLDSLNTQESGFRFVTQGIGQSVDPDTERVYEMNVNCFMLDGKLRIGWRYAGQLHRRETVVALLARYRDALLGLPVDGRAH